MPRRFDPGSLLRPATRRRGGLATRGQASLEYVAAIALVAVLLATAGSLVGAPSITNAVGRQMRHALCVVTGDSCAAVELQPCILSTGSLRGTVGAKLAIVSIGGETTILRIERSDGTTDLTLLDEVTGGVDAGVGAKGELDLGQRTLDASGMAEAKIIATLGGGTTWRVGSRKEADDLQRKLKEVVAGRAAGHAPGLGKLLSIGQGLLHVGKGTKLPEPRSHSVNAKASGQVKAALGTAADLTVDGSAMLGAQKLHDGSLILSFTVEGSAGLELAAATGVASGKASTDLTVTFDREGRPTKATVTGIGTLSGRIKLPRRVVDRHAKAADEMRVLATLDLTDARFASAVRGVLSGLRPGHVQELPDAVRALADGIASSAALDVSSYRTTSRAYGGDLEAGLGLKAGIDAKLELDSAVLTGAWSRPPAGAWEQRGDCVA